jgi:hypothetical protein
MAKASAVLRIANPRQSINGLRREYPDAADNSESPFVAFDV